MSPEQRVNLALELSSSITSITMDSIKNQNPRISASRLLELTRKRFQLGSQGSSSQKHTDDIRAILANTRINKRKVLDQARRDGTVEIFREIFRSTETRRHR